MSVQDSNKEIELAKRGVDAFIDRANELHHQGRYIDAMKQLERARRICEKKLGPLNQSTVKVLFIMSSMREADGTKRGPSNLNLHFVGFDSRTAQDTREGYFQLARILRRRIFVEELGVGVDVEFDEHDFTSQHVLGLFGDAPVTYARWHIVGHAAVVDRLCTLPEYRRRSVARRCLEYVAHDVMSSNRLTQCVECLSVMVPNQETELQQKLAQAHFVPMTDTVFEHLSTIQMCRAMVDARLPIETTSSGLP